MSSSPRHDALAAQLEGTVVFRTGTPGGDTDGPYIDCGEGRWLSVGERGIGPILTRVPVPEGARWVKVLVAPPASAADTPWLYDYPDEWLVHIDGNRAHTVFAGTPDLDAVDSLFPPAFCQGFAALQNRYGRPLEITLIRRLGALVSGLPVIPGDIQAVRRALEESWALLGVLAPPSTP